MTVQKKLIRGLSYFSIYFTQHNPLQRTRCCRHFYLPTIPLDTVFDLCHTGVTVDTIFIRGKLLLH